MQRSTTPAAVLGTALLAGALSLGGAGNARAESIEGALGHAYGNNPQLNAARAGTRAVDENVTQALSNDRPRVSGTATAGVSYLDSTSPAGSSAAALGAGGGGRREQGTVPRSLGLQVDQNLFNGFRTQNLARAAESQVFGSREGLRTTEQTVLQNGVVAYMNVLRDTAILELRRNNVEVLEEQLRQTRDRFQVGEITRTDVAQAESRLALARSDTAVAEGNLKASIATYRQVIGVEPRRLSPARPVDRLLPKGLDAALRIGLSDHPSIVGALHDVDVQALQVKAIEGELLPQVGLRGTLSRAYDQQVSNSSATSVGLLGTLTVPIYEGGATYSRVRQAKETLGQRRIVVEQQRDAVRQATVAAWGNLEATRAQIVAAEAGVRASEVALAGVREEAKVGQRTTLDVLNSQQELLIARVTVITAQRDRVVASYSVLQAIGRLSAATLSLKVPQAYDPSVHYEQVRDKWIGLRTPDGK